MDMVDLMKRRAQVAAMRKDLDKSRIEYKKELELLQGACHHESVVQSGADRSEERRVCVICGLEEQYLGNNGADYTYGYAKLGNPFAVQEVSMYNLDEYRKLPRLVLVPVPAPEPKAAK